MYLLIGIWGSTGEVRPRGIFAWAFRETGVGTKEYAAMKLTLYLLFGSAFILVGIFALYVNAGRRRRSRSSICEATAFEPGLQRWVFLAFYVGLRDPGRHLAAAHLVARRPRLGADRGLDAPRRRAHEARRLRRRAAWAWACCPTARVELAWLVGGIACINIVYGALSAMAQTDLKYVIAYSSVSHMGLVMLGAATLTEAGLNGSVFQMFAHGVMTGLFFALVGLVYEKAHSREIVKMGGFGRAMPGIATAFTVGGLSSLGLPATAGLRRRDPDLHGRLALGATAGGSFPAVAGTFLTAVYVLRVAKQIFWGPPSPHFHHLEDARGPEWVALVLLVARHRRSSAWCRASRSAPVDTATVPLLSRIVSP